MKLLECLRAALTALGANTLRSILTTLGIIIGVASVIVMVAVGAGARSEVDRRISSLGTNVLQVRPGSKRVSSRATGAGTTLPLSERDLAAIKSHVAGVVAISGSIEQAAAIVYGNVNWPTTVEGVHADYLSLRNWALANGRFFTSSEERSAAKVATIGATAAKQLFGEQDPTGAVVRIMHTPFTIIGRLEPKGASASMSGRDQDDVILIPMSTARMKLMSRNKLVPDQVGRIWVKLEDNAAVQAAQADIEAILRTRRRIQPGTDDDFNVRDPVAYRQAQAAAEQTMSLLLGATAAISLVVGGIGIMNIMLVSVTERTREIGLRMAVGARQRDILLQFLVEAVTLCLIGGLIGLAIGVAATIAVANLAEWPVLIGPEIIALALAAAAATGVFFGFFPARRAAHLNPIDALRAE